MKILITGGSGFIGSALIRYLVTEKKTSVLNIDKLTYAAHPKALALVEKNPLYTFKKADICDEAEMKKQFEAFQPDSVFHLAAESHVDRSIENPDNFIQSNIIGTYSLLKTANNYWQKKNKFAEFRFVHVSTDEVYGSLKLNDPLFTENTPYQPNSPYSSSKAASDHLARAWHSTYGLPTIITHCSNNYGPFQNSEKLIPLMIQHCLEGKPLPIYGKGENIRDWIYVDDHVKGIETISRKGVPGETYNMGGENEITNITLVKTICSVLDKIRPRKDGKSYAQQISFVKDRLGHDLRYAISNEKISRELGWKPQETLEKGLIKTIEWNLENQI